MDTQTRVTEIAAGIHQLTTVIPDAPVAFNQYLIAAAEPLLFHTGMRGLFPLVSAGVSTVLPADTRYGGSASATWKLTSQAR